MVNFMHLGHNRSTPIGFWSESSNGIRVVDSRSATLAIFSVHSKFEILHKNHGGGGEFEML